MIKKPLRSYWAIGGMKILMLWASSLSEKTTRSKIAIMEKLTTQAGCFSTITSQDTLKALPAKIIWLVEEKGYNRQILHNQEVLSF